MLTHIVISPEPLIGESDREALCGKLIRNPVKVWIAENPGKSVKELFNALLKCSRCWRADWDGRYVYGMVPGAELTKRTSQELGRDPEESISRDGL